MRLYQSKIQISSILCAGLLSAMLLACAEQPQAPAAAPTPVASAPVAAMPAPSAAPVAASAAPAPAAAPAAAPAEHHGHKGGHPMVAMLVDELGQVGIKPEQKAAVDAIVADMEKMGDATKEARTQLSSDIAEGAAAGKLDKAKIDADVKKLAQAADATAATMQDNVNKLHKTLDPTQRKKLVELMRAKGKEHEEHMKAEMGEHEKGAHEHEKGDHDKASHGEHGRMDKMGEMLGLTPEQKEKLKGKLEAGMKAEMGKMKEHHAEMEKRMKAIGDAFETEKFDAKKAGVGEKGGEMVKMMTGGKIHMVEAVLSVLTPEQRAKFAEHLRSHGDDDED
jgi:Spy/CpxP family protein refolding chaperone